MAGMRYQPQGLARIDAQNPLTRGLLFAMAPQGAGVIDATGHTQGALSSANAAPSLSKFGKGLTFAGGGPLQIAPATDTRFDLGGECTLFVICTPTNVNNGSFGQYPLAQGDSGASTTQIGVKLLGNAIAYWGAGSTITGATTLTNGVPVAIAVTRTGTPGAWIGNVYVNGKLDGTGSAFGNPGSQQVLAIGSFGATTGFNLPYSGQVHAALVYNRALSAAEVARLYANPWQVFQADDDFDFVVASAGTNLTPGFGALTIAGFAPTVAQPYTVIPGPGAITVTGYAPSVSQSVSLTPAPGALVLAGYAPTVTQPKIITPGAGALTVIGFAPTVSQIKTISPLPGALVISGYAPAVSQPRTITPSAGQLVITGYAPSISQVYFVAPQVFATTIMSDHAIDASVPALSCAINATTTMRGRFDASTIISAHPINGTGSLSAKAINGTANLL